MITFVIDKSRNQVEDLAHAIKCGVDFVEWSNPGDYFYVEVLGVSDEMISKQPKDEVIPIGSVEFVEYFLDKYMGIPYMPAMNVPEQLNSEEFLGRKIWESIDVEGIHQKTGMERLFIKPCDRNKQFDPEIIVDGSVKRSRKTGKVFASEVVNIKDEWRIFVHRHSVVGIKPVFSIPVVMPDMAIINKMTERMANSKSPASYTLDVAILDNGRTVLIEAHPFASCGLYGFEDYSTIVGMSINGYRFYQKFAG